MAHTLTPVSAFDSAVNVPDDGDDLNAASVDAAFQPLTNRTEYLRDVVRGTHNAEALAVTGSVTAGSLLTAGALTSGTGQTFNGGLTNLSTSTQSGLATFNGGLQVGGGSTNALAGGTLGGALVAVGAGRIVAPTVKAPDANTSYQPAFVRRVLIPATNAARTYTIDDTSAVDGDAITFVAQRSSTAIHTIALPGPRTVAIKGASGQICDATFVRVAGVWEDAEIGSAP